MRFFMYTLFLLLHYIQIARFIIHTCTQRIHPQFIHPIQRIYIHNNTRRMTTTRTNYYYFTSRQNPHSNLMEEVYLPNVASGIIYQNGLVLCSCESVL